MDNDNNNYNETQEAKEPIVINSIYDQINRNKIVSNDNGNGKKTKNNRNGHGGFFAIVICCCIVLSSVFGVGGGMIMYGYLDRTAPAADIKTPDNGAVNQSNETKAPSVIKQVVESQENTGIISNDAIVNAVARIKEAVVEISTETTVTGGGWFGGREYVTGGAGSGVIITEDGYILTCAHVVEGADKIKVTVTSGSSYTEYPAEVIGIDTQTDIAVIKIAPDSILTAAVMGNSSKLVVGEPAIAIGNPLGTLGGTVSNGIISALDREIKIDGSTFNLLQTNAAINPGNSGGGLFNINGELIGIVNAKSSGNIIEGLGFAIPIDTAKNIAEEIMTKGYISGRPRLGINVLEVNRNTDPSDYMGELANYVDDYGVYFLGYAGTQSGDLEFGDRIIAIDETSVSTMQDIKAMLTEYNVGDTLTLTVVRKDINSKNMRNRMVKVEITLVEYAG